MFRLLPIIALILLSSCSGVGRPQADQVDSTGVITVDSLMSNIDDLVGKKVTVEGVCAHFGKFEGRRAILRGSSDTVEIRCDATPHMGPYFSHDCLGKRVVMTGLLQERRINEIFIQQLEHQVKARSQQMTQDAMANHSKHTHVGYSTMGGVEPEIDSTFAVSMSDYRKRIEEQMANGGKDYISAYYIDVLRYEIVE